MAGTAHRAPAGTVTATLLAASVGMTIAACGGERAPPADGCKAEDRLTVPGPSDLTASMRTVDAGQMASELLVRPDGAVRLERRGREPVCYSVPKPVMADLTESLEGFGSLRKSYGPRPTPSGRVERTVTAGANSVGDVTASVRSVDGASRPRRLTRAIAALERVARAAP